MALLVKCYFIYIYKKDQSKILKINWKIMDNIRGRLRHIKVEFIASTIYIPREHVEERFQTKDSGRRENKTIEKSEYTFLAENINRQKICLS